MTTVANQLNLGKSLYRGTNNSDSKFLILIVVKNFKYR